MLYVEFLNCALLELMAQKALNYSIAMFYYIFNVSIKLCTCVQS